jgi:hypothetical protein
MEGFTRRQERRRGYGLIEAAIVLALVGAVIGGIWWAAAKVRENYNVNKTIEGILSIANNIQNSISIQNAMSIPHNTNLNSFAINSGAIPEGWINGTGFNTPLGYSLSLQMKSYGGQKVFYMHTSFDRKACLELTQKVVVLGNQDKKNLLAIRLPDGVVHTFPISMDVLESKCASGSYAFVFGFTRVN